MFRTFLNQFAPGGETAEATLQYEGLSWGWAFLLLVLLGFGAWWAYRRFGATLTRGQRTFLVTLRILLIAFFLLLLVRPILLITINEPIRERLLVLLDASESMNIVDQRSDPEDVDRAAIATGTKDSDQSAAISRATLLRELAANDRLQLWPRLQEKADLQFFGAGSGSRPLGALVPPDDTETVQPASVADAQRFFDQVKFDQPVTALGDSLREMLDANRAQPVAGVLVITDGANNSGIAPEEIAQAASQEGLALLLYGIGITAPKDIAITELVGPRGAFVEERAEFTVGVQASGYEGRKVNLELAVDGEKVDEREITLSEELTADFELGYVPDAIGEFPVTATITPLDGEAEPGNNTATTRVRVLDRTVRVLYVEGEPRWDFRYLLSTLHRDRRLAVKCLLFDGDEVLLSEPDTPFLAEFPKDRAEIVGNEIIILGDVDPSALGEDSMKLINEWVGELGGGLIFLAGPKHNPFQYAGTPLEPLLPVELDSGLTPEQWSARNPEPVPLRLTPTGELSPLLQIDPDPDENRRLWANFPGVRWTARVARARPTAQTFLVDTSTETGGDADPMPVIAQQSYGKGAVMYFGFDETYRWRSQVGEKFYLQIWNQVIQSFSLERQLGASDRTQLRTDKSEYSVGDTVVITGKLFTESLDPLTEASVPGSVTIRPLGGEGEGSRRDLRLRSDPDREGEYRGEIKADQPGEYGFATLLDLQSLVKFSVVEPRSEKTDIALNVPLLQSMAQISGGKFLREEDLDALPDLIAERSATVPSFRRIDLIHSLWLMVILMILALTEWLFRRLWQLK